MIKIKLLLLKYSLVIKIIGIIIASIPTIYGANSFMEEHYKTKVLKEQHVSTNDQTINTLSCQMDTVIKSLKIQSNNQKIFLAKLDTVKNMTLTVKDIVKSDILSRAKDKDAILKVVESFGPYFNMRTHTSEKKNDQQSCLLLNPKS